MSYRGEPVAPIGGDDKPEASEISKYYGFDSMSMYNWKWPWKDGYAKWRSDSVAQWDGYRDSFGVFFPIVSSGWDNNPRYPAEKTTLICSGKSPEEYEKSLRIAKSWADENIPEGMPKLIFINAWNEWTEGEYLEPDNHYGYGFLNATARVFGGSGQAK